VAPAAPASDVPAGFFSADPLTGLRTFQPFSQRLLEEFHRVKRTEECAALVLVDVNHLAQINEQFGVEAGDQVLRQVSACLELSKRGSDVLARMGDDEFGLLLLDCDRAGAGAFIERVQELLARESISVEVEGGSTSVWTGICAGVAIFDSNTGAADDVLTAAVDDLNEAREARDRRRERWREAA
jgi:diguanylate cyclase (GGDEF)-like protein